MNRIVLAYIGVHQIFQLALAAQELGELERLFCSLIDLPGKWGAKLCGRVNATSLRPMGFDDLDPSTLQEIPAPLLARHLRMRLSRHPSDFYGSNVWFDRIAARRITKMNPSHGGLFVGAETCALESMRAARTLGMKRILDCPGIAAEALSKEAQIAAEELGITCALPGASPRVNERKAAEMEEADILLFCSELQKSHYLSKGLPENKMRVNPLWVDPLFSNATNGSASRRAHGGNQPLKVLFVGGATLAKGAAYAIQAVEGLSGLVSLTFCGGISPPIAKWAGNRLNEFKHIPWIPRTELQTIYADHDVLIFPTLGDSFGFVALEAMACGLPVITTTTAGASLPSEAWRVPVRNAAALTTSLVAYATDRDKLEADSSLAFEFSKAFTPAAYRQRAAAIFAEALN